MRKQIQICGYACFLYCLTLIGCKAAHGAYSGHSATGSTSVTAHKNNGINETTINKKAAGKKSATVPFNELRRRPMVITQPQTADKQPAGLATKTENTSTATDSTRTVIILHDTVDNKSIAKATAIKTNSEAVKDSLLAEEASERSQPATEEPAPLQLSDEDSLVLKYAELINVEQSKITNYPLYQFIDDWYGTRYRWGGADNNGIDCSAFSQKLYDEVFGMELPRTSRQQHRTCIRIKEIDEANEGDLIFFRIHRILVSHVGVYLANGYFVHASRSKGVVISNLNNKYWSRRYAGCGRMIKDEGSSVSEILAP